MDQTYKILTKSLIFNGLDEISLEILFKDKLYRIRQYEKGGYIAHSHDECDRLMIVMKGSVRGEMTDFSGKTIIIEEIRAPRPLASAFLFGNNNRFPVDIIANEASTIMVLPKETLIAMMQQNSLVLRNYLDAISSRTQFLSNRIRFLSFRTIREKIAQYILTMGGNEKNTIMMTQSQTNLADFFGVARPSLARAFHELEQDGIIRIERREITLLNKEKLNNLLHH